MAAGNCWTLFVHRSGMYKKVPNEQEISRLKLLNTLTSSGNSGACCSVSDFPNIFPSSWQLLQPRFSLARLSVCRISLCCSFNILPFPDADILIPVSWHLTCCSMKLQE